MVTQTASDEAMFTMIDSYYSRHKYVMPDKQEALAFVLSEVGEVALAYVELNEDVDPKLKVTLCEFARLGYQADGWVADRKGWVRNNDRVKTPSIPDELADSLMMMYVVAASMNIGPVEALTGKMRKKLEEAYSKDGNPET